MFTWIVVAVTAVVAVAALALLVVREPLSKPRQVPPVAGPHQVRRRFGWRWPGYDPDEVDAHLAAVDRAWRRQMEEPRGRAGSAEELEDGGRDGAGRLDG
ncbi:hypothetical protein [Egicoccus sp. AB-alg2]|uniref:hypothetical protein n=1 Tax=Egicoccus sp. AB-alg2 TaxID=3242693 RepID=UPI00359E47EB